MATEKRVNEIIEFKRKVAELCVQYGVSISHEDTQGAFVIEDYNQFNVNWFLNAETKVSEADDGFRLPF